MSSGSKTRKRKGDLLSAPNKKQKNEEDTDRKSLQTLQQTADNQNILTGSSGVINLKQKTSKKLKSKVNVLKSKKIKVLDETEKENSTVAAKPCKQKLLSAYSPGNDENTQKSRLVKVEKPKNKKNKAFAKKSEKIPSTAVKETTKCKNLKDVISVMNDTQAKTTGSVPSEVEFWKNIAEENQIELQRALEKNESLHEQQEVLIADNAEVESLLNKAEELIRCLEEYGITSASDSNEPTEKYNDSTAETSIASTKNKKCTGSKQIRLQKSKPSTSVNLSNANKSKNVHKSKCKKKVDHDSGKIKEKNIKKGFVSKNLEIPNSGDEVGYTHRRMKTDDISDEKMSDEMFYTLMSDTDSEAYWKFVGKQRQKTLETVSQENESIRDQLVELEAKNVKLNSLLSRAKELAEVVLNIVE